MEKVSQSLQLTYFNSFFSFPHAIILMWVACSLIKRHLSSLILQPWILFKLRHINNKDSWVLQLQNFRLTLIVCCLL